MSSPHDLATELIGAFRSPGPEAVVLERRQSERVALGPAVEFEPLGHGGRPKADLLTTLQRRRSLRFFEPKPVPARLLADIVARAIAMDVDSWPDEQANCPLQTDLVAFRVEELEPGMFSLDAHERSYTPIAPLPPPETLHDLTLQWEFCESAAIVSIAADLDRVSEMHGAHGYRLLLCRAAAAAYTMWLDAVSAGLAGTVFAGFIPASVRQPLRSDGASRHQIFALALGVAARQSPGSPETPGHG